MILISRQDGEKEHTIGLSLIYLDHYFNLYSTKIKPYYETFRQ